MVKVMRTRVNRITAVKEVVLRDRDGDRDQDHYQGLITVMITLTSHNLNTAISNQFNLK